MTDVTIVEATGTAAGGKHDFSRGRAVEDAMSAAIADAHEAGITDPAEIRKRMLAARDGVRAAQRTNTHGVGRLL